MDEEQIFKKLSDKAINLPTLPNVVTKVAEMINNPRVSSSDISTVFSQDPALTAKILKLVNSAFYGFPRKISTVNHAIVILGFDVLRDIALSASVFELFPTKDSDTFSRALFWEHCIATGAAARMLAKSFRYRIVGEAFVAGLLHDIGKVLMDQYFNKEFVMAMETAERDDIYLWQAEEQYMGITHMALGRWLAEQWNLPEDLTEVIACHHHPDKAEVNPDLTAIVHLGHILTMIRRVGFSGNRKFPSINRSAWETLKRKKPDLNQTDIFRFLKDLDPELKKTEDFIRLARGEKSNG